MQTAAKGFGAERGFLLGSMSPGARQELLARGRPRLFAKGETIYARGEPGGSMLVVRTGRVEISVAAADGRVSVLNFMGPGDVVGEISLLDGKTRSADAIAATEVTGVLVERGVVQTFLRREPDVALAVIAELCDKVRNASDMFETQAKLSGPARLARCLLRIADRWGERRPDGTVTIPAEFSQGGLGDYAGLSRESVNRLLRAWVGEGFIALDSEDRRLALLDLDTLDRLAA